MVKQTSISTTNEKILTIKEHLRHSSNALQRHIFHKNSLSIQEFLNQNIKTQQISFTTHDKYMDLLRQTNKQTQNRIINPMREDISDKDSQQQKIKIHKEVSLENEFQVMLDKSFVSYEKTYSLFRKLSLLQKYGHLVGLEQQQQQKIDVEDLTEQEERALKKIKIVYRRYRVSNMYKSSISSRIRKVYIQKLIQKGYLRQKNQIISLAT